MKYILNRNAIVVYLRNCRDLEVTKWKIYKMFMDENSAYVRKKDELSSPVEEEIPLEKNGIDKMLGSYFFLFMRILVVALDIACFCFVFNWIYSMMHSSDNIDVLMALHQNGLAFLTLCIIVGVITVIFWGDGRFTTPWKMRRENRQISEENSAKEKINEERREIFQSNQKLLPEVTDAWSERARLLMDEYRRVDQMLRDTYALGLIPDEYQHPASICFLYNSIADGTESFEDALKSCNPEEIEKSDSSELDEIILKNEVCIRAQREMYGHISKLMDHSDGVDSGYVTLLKICMINERNPEISIIYRKMLLDFKRADIYFSSYTYTNIFYGKNFNIF